MIIQAKVKSVNKQISKTGDPGINIVLVHDDGSEYGKKIYQWLWASSGSSMRQEQEMQDWADLSRAAEAPKCSYNEALEIVAGANWQLCGTEVDLEVEKGEKFWKIQRFGPANTMAFESKPAPSDIPF